MITNGWSTLFNYKKLWFRQKSTLLDLYQLKNELGYRKSRKMSIDSDELYSKYLMIWEKDSNEWRNITQTQPMPSKTNSPKTKN